MQIDPNSNPNYKSTEYADWWCWKSVMAPYIEQGWETTPTGNFSTPMMDFVDWDATISKDGTLRYIVEIKSRGENIRPTTYNEFLIDAAKIDKLLKGMEDNGVEAYIFELFPKHGVGYIWHITPLTNKFRTCWKVANQNTIAGDNKVKKLCCMLPHSSATFVSFSTDTWDTMKQKADEYYSKKNNK